MALRPRVSALVLSTIYRERDQEFRCTKFTHPETDLRGRGAPRIFDITSTRIRAAWDWRPQRPPRGRVAAKLCRAVCVAVMSYDEGAPCHHILKTASVRLRGMRPAAAADRPGLKTRPPEGLGAPGLQTRGKVSP